MRPRLTRISAALTAAGRALRGGGLNLATGVFLELTQPLARNFLGIAITTALIFKLQAGPFLRIHRRQLGSPELAIGHGLGQQEIRIRPVNPGLGISNGFGISNRDGDFVRAHDRTDGSRPGHLLNRLGLARQRIAREAAERDCGKNHGDAGKPEGERRRARPTRRREIATAASNMRWSCDQHPQSPKARKANHPSQRAG